MGAKDILSKDEIDALLHSDDDSTDGSGGVPEGGVRGFDFENQERIVQGRQNVRGQLNVEYKFNNVS
jgi:flagellar motor switch protein FliM